MHFYNHLFTTYPDYSVETIQKDPNDWTKTIKITKTTLLEKEELNKVNMEIKKKEFEELRRILFLGRFLTANWES